MILCFEKFGFLIAIRKKIMDAEEAIFLKKWGGINYALNYHRSGKYNITLSSYTTLVLKTFPLFAGSPILFISTFTISLSIKKALPTSHRFGKTLQSSLKSV
jgi:hypothetical protein